MKKKSLSAVSEAWKEHVLERISAAEDIGLIESSDRIDFDQAVIFFPEAAEESSIAASTPHTTINEILSVSRAPGKWTERIECLEEAVQAIKDLCNEQRQYFLLCEAGYIKAGDKVLEKYRHILLGDSPILFIGIHSDSAHEIAKVLKAGRSQRILGAIKGEVVDETNLIGKNRFFFCDALDGDSVLICPIL